MGRAITAEATGTTGVGKTTVAASFANSVCRAGHRCIYLAFEESAAQLIRNMRSVGIDLEQWADKGLLTFRAMPSTSTGLEEHLLTMVNMVAEGRPAAVVLDPITSLISIATQERVRRVLMRLFSIMKNANITNLSTALNHGSGDPSDGLTGVSSSMDTVLVLRNLESNGERKRGIYIMKSRGMHHSNQVREFRLTSRGMHILDVYSASGAVPAGSARIPLEAGERETTAEGQQALERRRRDLAQRQKTMQARGDVPLNQLAGEEEDVKSTADEEKARQATASGEHRAVADAKMADVGISGRSGEAP